MANHSGTVTNRSGYSRRQRRNDEPGVDGRSHDFRMFGVTQHFQLRRQLAIFALPPAAMDLRGHAPIDGHFRLCCAGGDAPDVNPQIALIVLVPRNSCRASNPPSRRSGKRPAFPVSGLPWRGGSGCEGPGGGPGRWIRVSWFRDFHFRISDSVNSVPICTLPGGCVPWPADTIHKLLGF